MMPTPSSVPSAAAPRRPFLRPLRGSIAALFTAASLAQAGQVWDGEGANGLWSNALNWSGNTLPNFANPLEFGGKLQLTANNDTTANVAGISFQTGAASFVLTGNAITLNGGITVNSASPQTVSLAAITLGSSQTFSAASGILAVNSDVDLGANTLTVTGPEDTTFANTATISGAGGITKTGTGRLTISGINTYTGTTRLEAGELFANGTANPFGTGQIVIAGNTRIGSVADNQILANNLTFTADGTNLTIEANTHLDFTGGVDLNGATRTFTGTVHQSEIGFSGVISNGGVTFETSGLGTGSTGNARYVAFLFDGAVPHTYSGLTTVNSGAFIVFNSAGEKIVGDVLIQGTGVVDYLGGSDQISDTSTVTVNSTGSTILNGTKFAGLELFNRDDTIGALFGSGTVGLGSGTLTVGAGDFTGVIGDGERGSGGDFVKNTAGRLFLTGTNTYTGTTTVEGGRLHVDGSLTSTTLDIKTGGTFIAGRNNSLPSAAAVTVAAGGGFEYQALNILPLNIAALTLNSGAGTTVGGSIGSTLTGSRINVTGAVTPTAGDITVNIYGSPQATGTTGTYTLLRGGAGSTLSTGTTYTLGTVFNATNFTVSGVSATATEIQAQITAATPLTQAFWRGGLVGNPNVWAASNGSTASNWASDAAGTATPLVPGAGTAVFFSATGAADPGAMELGANMSIASLTINAPASPETRAVMLNRTGGDTLTIATAGGLTVNSGAGAVTLNPNLVLGASQTWTNNSANLLTVGGDIANGANTLTIAGGGNSLITGVLGNGSGGLVKTGAGRLTVTANNTYTGDTQLQNGALFEDVPGGGSVPLSPFGTGQLFAANETTLGTTIITGGIPNNVTFEAGTHFITTATQSTPSVRPTFSFTGTIDLSGGTSELIGTTAGGNIVFSNVIANGAITLSNSSGTNTTFIYGVNSSNTDVPNTYTGLTTVNNKVILLLNKSVAAAGGNAAVVGDILINPGGSVQYFNVSNQIADTSRITVNSSGIDQDGTDYAGFDLLNNSDTIGALSGDGTVGLGSGSLTVGAGNFSGVIGKGAAGEGGQLTKNTAGTLTLSGANTFTGNTNINNGALVLNGSVQSPTVFVNFSGTLMGTGRAARNVVNAGVFSPGTSTGTFNIGGNFSQNAAGTLVIEIAGSKPGEHDLVKVGGTASLAGTLRLTQVKGARLKVGEKVTFLTAGGGVTGEFTNVTNPFTNAATLTAATVVYESNAVSVVGTQGSFSDFAAQFGLNSNQRRTATALDQIADDPQQAKLIAYLNDRLLTDLPRDFDLIAPEELQAIYTIGISQANVQAVNLQRRLADIRAGQEGFSAAGLSVSGLQSPESELPPPPPPAAGEITPGPGATGPAGAPSKELRPPADRRYGAFFTGTGEWVKVGTSSARGYDLTGGGFTLGVDYRINENFAVGVNVGYARTRAELFGDGEITVDGAKLGAYATYVNEAFYADAALQGGYNSYDTRRTGLEGSPRGSTSGGEFSALLAIGYDFKSERVEGLTFGPTASLQYTYLGFGGFRETGSLAPLDYPDQGGTSFVSTLGAKATYDWRIGGVLVRPELRAAWQHEYGDVAFGIDSRFRGSGSQFTVAGAEIGRDSLLLGAGVAVLWNERTATYLYYDGEIGRSNYDTNNLSGGVRVTF